MKKGFTLVELLAVIAILAILIAITMPNIMRQYNKAKADTFVVDVQTVMDVAMSKYTMDTLQTSEETIYYSSKEITGLNAKKLDVTSENDYFIEMDRHGNFKRVIVYNAQYCYDVHTTYGSNSPGIIDGSKSKQFTQKITKTDVTTSDVWLSGNDLMQPNVDSDETGNTYYNIIGCEGTAKIDLGKENPNDLIINGEQIGNNEIDYENIGLNEFDAKLTVNNGTGGSLRENIKYGTTIMWMVYPAENYTVEGATVTGNCTLNGNKVSLTVNKDTECTIDMKQIYKCSEGTLKINESGSPICVLTVGNSYPCNCRTQNNGSYPVYGTCYSSYQCGTETICNTYGGSGQCIGQTTRPRICTAPYTCVIGYNPIYSTVCDTCYSNLTNCPAGWKYLTITECYKNLDE